MRQILKPTFFKQNVLVVAKELLGKYLVRKINEEETAAQINEVEAYDGPNDLACHGRFGKTNRTEAMFGPPGYFYVYLVYGIHWMLNIVTNQEGYPAAVLIRGAGHLNGPAKLTKFLSIDKSLNQKPVSQKSNLWVEDRKIIIQKNEIIKTPRIGVDYAGPVWAKKQYRFILKN